MTRLLIHVEGQTEEAFVQTTLGPHLYECGYEAVGARLLGNARSKARRGGIIKWPTVRHEIELHLKSDRNAFATIMVDYYGLPNSWPGRMSPQNTTIEQKSDLIRQALLDDFEAKTNILDRFEPFVLMHEFEALLFSDCTSFANAIGFASKALELQTVRDAFPDPEHINDSPQTAPSKRVAGIIKGYDKILFGNVAASEIGLSKIRQECPRFDYWLQRLEAWGPQF